MSGAEIIRVPFGDSLVSVHRKPDETLWMTRDELSLALGFAEADGVRYLERNHSEEIAPFKGWVDLPTPGGVQQVVAYEERALYILSCLARTKPAPKFRLWAANTFKDLRIGRSGLFDRAQIESRLLALEADVARERADRLAAQRDRFEAAQTIRRLKSDAGAMLAQDVSPRLRVLGEEDPNQGDAFRSVEERVEDSAKARGDGRITAVQAAALLGLSSTRELGRRVKAGSVARRYTGTRRPYAIDDIRKVLTPAVAS